MSIYITFLNLANSQQIIFQLVIIDPEKRLDMQGVLTHPWIVKNRKADKAKEI